MRALVLAGGAGTRLRPLTDTRPKPLVPLVGAPFAAGLLRRLADVGCERATFLVSDDARPFAPLQHLGEASGIAVDIATEETPLDTAGAVRRALAGPGTEAVLVANGDILTDLDFAALMAAHAQAGATATLALARVPDTRSFGVVVTGESGQVQRFVEKPPPGTEVADTINAGTYVLDPAAFAAFPGDGPLSFEREVFPGLLDAGARMLGVVHEGYWADLGTPARLREAHAAVIAGRCRWPLGAQMVLDGGIARHEDAVVDDAAGLAGPVTVSGRARVENAARLHDVVLGEDAFVGRDAVVEEAILGEGAEIGDGARVTGDVVLGDGAVVGEGAQVGPGVRIQAGAAVEPRARIGPDTEVEA